MLFASTLLALAAAGVQLANAQLNYSTNGSISIVPDSVPLSERESWCLGQQNTCPEICGGAGNLVTNGCNAIDLTYNCTCVGTTPNISSYQTTLPFYICQQWMADCVSANAGDQQAIDSCNSVTCGTKNATAQEASASSAAAASTSSAAASSASSTLATTTTGGAATTTTGSATAASTSATKTGAAVALSLGREYGTGLIGAGVLVAFGLVL